MDEEKQSESSGEEVEQVGPYQLQEQVPQDEQSHGELYRATHETSGATALVLKPTPEDEARSGPLTDWQVRCVSSDSPSYLALEVEHSAWSVAPDRHSVETLMCLFEEVRDGVKRMDRAFPASTEPRRGWRLGLAVAGAAAVCVLLFSLMHGPPASPAAEGTRTPWARAEPAPMNEEVPTDTGVSPTGSLFWEDLDGGAAAIARPFPSKPYKGQRRPPCAPRIEVEIMGACWVPHKLTAPCPEELYEYKGECYTASMRSQSPPQSLGQ
jgi:hypothetical protein